MKTIKFTVKFLLEELESLANAITSEKVEKEKQRKMVMFILLHAQLCLELESRRKGISWFWLIEKLQALQFESNAKAFHKTLLEGIKL